MIATQFELICHIGANKGIRSPLKGVQPRGNSYDLLSLSGFKMM